MTLVSGFKLIELLLRNISKLNGAVIFKNQIIK
jgi:hypothetical protein